MIHVIDVQSRATMQDLGRFGLRRFGISHCGAMDKLALRAGNILLGNAEGAPAIEVHLGGLPESLHTPRRAVPRTLVPAGSVGIGGAQTGIYPFSSPGGWQLIGHTKHALFDKNQAKPTLLQAGDTVKFVVEGIEL